MTRFTKEQWLSLTERLHLRIHDDIFERLRTHYSSSPRSYHNSQHIDDCLRQFDDFRSIAHYPDEVEIAIWFHDVVYDTHTSENEAKSAALARSILCDAQCGEEIVDRVSKNILATKHDSTTSRIDEKLIVDIDLSIFGRTAHEYDRYESAIREEYSWVPWKDYAVKRTEILQSFLNRSHIYVTKMFATRFEANARLNLKRAIGNLAVDQQR